MRTIDSLAAKKEFSKDAIMNDVAKLSIVKRGGNIITKYDGKHLSTFAPSEIYEMVNFKKVVGLLLDQVEHIMSPSHYNFTVKSGYQELKLKGQPHVINGDTFHEMVWLTNSTDGTKRLSVRYGLMRQICSNGACVTVSGSSFKVKHLTDHNVNKELEAFIMNLPKLDVAPQVKKLKTVAKKEITIGKLSNALVNEIGTKGNDKIWNLLVRKLVSSKTDRLGDKFDAAITGIQVPFKELTKETLDTPIPAWNVLQCYTELWRSLDAGEIERETNKILEVLN